MPDTQDENNVPTPEKAPIPWNQQAQGDSEPCLALGSSSQSSTEANSVLLTNTGFAVSNPHDIAIPLEWGVKEAPPTRP